MNETQAQIRLKTMIGYLILKMYEFQVVSKNFSTADSSGSATSKLSTWSSVYFLQQVFGQHPQHLVNFFLMLNS
jgi:hypothetical protein